MSTLRISYDSYIICSAEDILNAIYEYFDEIKFNDYTKTDIINEFYYNTLNYLLQLNIISTDKFSKINNLEEIRNDFTRYVSSLTYLKNTFE